MATIHIDNTPHEADERRNLLEVCAGLGLDVPYFCWHPAMGSVGACRQCAVKQYKDENDDQGRIVMSCMTPAKDGTRISIDDPEVAAFRAQVIEWLMINHPHDCPVCEEGGECHLQDMTVMTGHTYRRHRFKKRTHRNQNLGPFIGHEMNRCIACYRCVRFYKEYAGGTDLDVFAAHDDVYFGRHEDGPLENEFSGNLAEVCPTGVFTDKTFSRHFTRKWDLQTAPSICSHCSIGCNTSPGARYGTLRRVVNRYNNAVNGYFICDRGRFGYEFVNGPERQRQSLTRVRSNDAQAFEPLGTEDAQAALLSAIGDERLAVIGSSRATLEANFALMQAVGKGRYSPGIGGAAWRTLLAARDAYVDGHVHPASIRDCEEADAVLVLGEDLTNTAPRLALALRQSVRHEAFRLAKEQGVPRWQNDAVRDIAFTAKSPLYVVTPDVTKLNDVAVETARMAPADIARLGFAVAHALDDGAPAVSDLGDDWARLAQRIADDLAAAKRPLVVSGVTLAEPAVIAAAASISQALQRNNPATRGAFVTGEANALGGAIQDGADLEDLLRSAADGNISTLIVAENDLYRGAEPELVDRALDAVETVIVMDSIFTPTTAKADIVIPVPSFAESSGSMVNFEGRAQRFFSALESAEGVCTTWRWLGAALAARDGKNTPRWSDLDAVIAEMAATMPALAGVRDAAPGADYRARGLKIARESERASGRTAMQAHIDVEEPRPAADADSPLAFSMEGFRGPETPSSLIPYFRYRRWNSQQAVQFYQQEVPGPLKGGDAGVRLIAAHSPPAPHYAHEVPDAFVRRDDRWQAVPLPRIFGSEELSALAPAVAQRAPTAYVAMSRADADRLGAAAGDTLRVDLGNRTLDLPLAVSATLTVGTVGLPSGIGDIPANLGPRWVRIERGAT